jgi:hypothetical protein
MRSWRRRDTIISNTSGFDFSMATRAEREAAIKGLDRDGVRGLWAAIQANDTPGWDGGEALEDLAIRAFEIDPQEPAMVRYPYDVPLFGATVEEIDGAIHIPWVVVLGGEQGLGR